MLGINIGAGWLGGYRDKAVGNSPTSFLWTDGTAWDYHAWNGGNPDNYRNKEDCVHVHPHASGWNDNNCGSGIPFVCKKGRKSSRDG